MSRVAFWLVSAVIVARAGASPDEQAIKNPGFEQPAGGEGLVAGWEVDRSDWVEVRVDEAVAHEGASSLGIVFPRPGAARLTQTLGRSGLFPGSLGRVAPGDYVIVTAWYRTDGLQAKSGSQGIMLELLGDGRRLGIIERLPPSPKWRKAVLRVRISDKVPCPGRYGVGLHVRDVTGRIWWDDVSLSRGAGGEVQYTEPHARATGAARPRRLQNAHAVLTLDANAGSILGLTNAATGTDCLVPSAEPALPFTLGFIADEPRHMVPRLLSARFERSRTGRQSARLTYELDDGRIKVVCLASLDSGPEIEWVLYVRNGSDVEIVEEAFPLLNGVRIGRRGVDDALAWPKRFGQRTQSPCGHVVRDIKYVGTASMPWMDLFDESRGEGIYLGSHDKMLLTTALRCFSHGPDESVGLELLKHARIRPGEDQRLGPVVVAPHAGDWHAAARIYRRWADTAMRMKAAPTWMAEAHSWHVHEFPHEAQRFASIPAMFDRATLAGADMVHRAGQMVRNGCARFYHLDPLLGTPAEFRAGNENVRRRGGHTCYYTNGFGWERLYPEHLPPDYKARLDAALCPTWEQMAPLVAKARDGSEIIQYPDRTGGNDDGLIMCPATKGWQEYLRFWIVDKYVKEYRAGAMQIDQVAADYPRPCYDANHGHDQYAVWGEGLARMLERISLEAAALDPDFAIWIEGASDALSQFADADYWTFEGDALPMFRYTFPEVKTACSPSNKTSVHVGAFLEGHAYAFVCWYGEGKEIREAAGRIRRRVADALYYARFRDDDGLGPLPEGVEAKVFVNESAGATAATVADLRAERTAFRLQLDRSVLPRKPRVGYWYPDPAAAPRRRLSLVATARGFSVTVPAAPHGTSRSRDRQPRLGVVVVSEDELRHLNVECPGSISKAATLHIRVASAGKSVGDAKVWVGDDERRVGPDGTLSYRFDARDPTGVYVLRARKEGYLSARAIVRVEPKQPTVASKR